MLMCQIKDFVQKTGKKHFFDPKLLNFASLFTVDTDLVGIPLGFEILSIFHKICQNWKLSYQSSRSYLFSVPKIVVFIFKKFLNMHWIRFSLIEGKIGIVRMVHGDAVHCGRAGGDIEGFWCNPAKSQLQDTKANPLLKMGRGFHKTFLFSLFGFDLEVSKFHFSKRVKEKNIYSFHFSIKGESINVFTPYLEMKFCSLSEGFLKIFLSLYFYCSGQVLFLIWLTTYSFSYPRFCSIAQSVPFQNLNNKLF